ncbi:TIGR02281 family clan AA aspartic protease [Ascidiaceihabitans sp.]|nr:TIGR02281 family clan AA aspartic protease [Ascidiaceihabitans sp.]MDB9946454.1 TIGR02281 family clan AA aspartic protease [Ascidiaceihabitans sp.]HCI07326.1 TIGR02281 family clan AA aspartic protease [Sulfitobacter sp.]
MTGDIISQVLYLSVFGVLIAVGLWARSRKNLSQTAQHAAIWALIFIAAIAVFGLWNDLERHLGVYSDDGHNRVTIPVSRNGHYNLRLSINSVLVDFVVDTGATDIVLSQSDAKRIGIDIDSLAFTGRASTANGVVETARITLDTIEIANIVDRDVSAVVNKGELFGSLLGMGYLQRWGRIEIENGILSLTR